MVNSYPLGSSSKVKCFNSGETFHLAKSWPSSTKICCNSFHLSSISGHIPSYTLKYGSMIPKASVSYLPALPSVILLFVTIFLSGFSRRTSLSRPLLTAACITPSNIILTGMNILKMSHGDLYQLLVKSEDIKPADMILQYTLSYPQWTYNEPYDGYMRLDELVDKIWLTKKGQHTLPRYLPRLGPGLSSTRSPHAS